MFKPNTPNLIQALYLLGFADNSLTLSGRFVSWKERASAWSAYLNLAGYLSVEAINMAVDYLAAEKPFKVGDAIIPPEQVKIELKQACDAAKSSGRFNPDIFLREFAKQPYFTVPDILDLLTFLQQTAFDRKFGQERDKLSTKSWMEEHNAEFIACADSIGMLSSTNPTNAKFCGVAIMGAGTFRMGTRIDYFAQLLKEGKIQFDSLWEVTGLRELSKGLDDEEVLLKIASKLGILLTYVEKPVAPNSKETRIFANGLNERMAMQFLIGEKLGGLLASIKLVNSGVEPTHWRATTAENAKDLAPRVIKMIQENKLQPSPDGCHHFMIIVEQPYQLRMAKQIQREFNAEIAKQKLSIEIQVEGSGQPANPGPKSLPSINSELAALLAEHFKDTRSMLTEDPGSLRNTAAIMFSSRDDWHKKILLAAAPSAPTPTKNPPSPV